MKGWQKPALFAWNESQRGAILFYFLDRLLFMGYNNLL